MLTNFREVVEKGKTLGPVTISVAVAQDKEVLEAVKMAQDAGLADAVLVGNEASIIHIMEEVGLNKDTPIFDEPDEMKAALKAVALVRNGAAHVLMKGLINSSDFLRAVLNAEVGLKTDRLLSHLAVFEIPGEKKLVYHTDGGMNVAPNLKEKKEILINTLETLRKLGIREPKVALLTANEKVSKKMPATVDASEILKMQAAGELPPAIIEGPIALDVALSPVVASHKGIDSRISGDVDLFLMPNIEAGNMLGKAAMYYGKAKMAGLVLGASNPIVLTSRAETAEGKMNSIALACVAAAGSFCKAEEEERK